MILITEKLSAIIDPIISRCQLFLISPPSFQDFKNLIKKIATNENLQLEDDTIAFLYRSTDGRMAQALDLLQLCSISASKIDANSLAENVALMQKDLIRSLLLRLLEGDFEKSREISRKIQNNYKVNAQQNFLMLFNELNRLPLSVYAKADIMNIIAEADFRSVDGRDIDIQLSNLLAQVCHYSNNL
jgi:DNA polymerase III delta prime subunit